MTEADPRVDLLQVGPLQVSCLWVQKAGDERVVLIDPGGDAPMLIERLGDGAVLDAIFLTHCHYDHIGGVNALMEAFPQARLICHPLCARAIVDPMMNLSEPICGVPYVCHAATETVADGDRFVAGGMDWEVVHLPGHTPGQVAYVHPAERVPLVFCGDTIFRGSIGRSDLPGGNEALLRSKCQAFLDSLPNEAMIYPGHGMPTFAGWEREHNPFFS